jgi:ABC-type transporter Mla maintaining outer membrane lipid asymmetry ATPase subunit MlaF
MGSDPVLTVPMALDLRDVEKQYGGLRPLRIRELHVAAGRCVMLLGFDRPAAEVFVNLITGAGLPDNGDVATFGLPTRNIVDSDRWLAFVEQFGIVSDRIVLLEAMTVAQNLAISFDLELDPVPADVLARVTLLAAEVGIATPHLDSPVAEAGPLLRSRLYLARALALDPAMLVLEHPTAALSADEASEYAALIRATWKRRALTTIGLTVDERFAKATGGRLLSWQPATGEMRVRSGLRFWSPS